MADYSRSKKFGTAAYPADTKESSNLFRRIEQLLTPELLVARYLKNIPQKYISPYTSEDFKDQIEIAINEFEILTDISVFKTQKRERIPYDSQLYKNFIHIKTNHRPILSVEKITVESSDKQTIYSLPPTWIESGFFHKGQINLLPILSVFGSSGEFAASAPSGSLIFLQSLAGFRWLPAFWVVEYTTGICHTDGNIPVIVNDIIGMIAAINILSEMQTRFLYTSQSLSQDGISQSSGNSHTPWQARIDQLEQRKERLLQQLKKVTHNKYYLSNI